MKSKILHIGLSLLGMLIPFGNLHASDAPGYPVETMQWGKVTEAQRSVIERLMTDLVLVPARDTIPAYYMGHYEVTQDAWRAVTGDSTRWDMLAGDSLPAHTLTYNEALTFVSRLNELTGKHFRLPTVEEWQWAAKGGQTYAYAGSEKLDEVGWYKDNCEFTLHPVGQKRPNGYGLYDMSGNVPEWCAPAAGAALMPLMGGGYWMEEAECAVTYVDSLDANVQTGGLRLVLDVIRTAEAKALVVTQADGTQEQYPLSLQPKVTVEAPNLYVEANGEKHTYDLKQMARMHYVTAAAAARGMAPEEDIDVTGRPNALFTYRNDGDFNAFLNIDVDSIVYSRMGIDNLEYNTPVVQEVWTPDSIYRIPLAAVDSIGFHQPKPVLRSEILYLNEYHALHINEIRDLTIVFDRFISPDSIPAVGQVLVSKYEGEPFEDGFVGKVKEVKNVSDGSTQVVCEAAGLSDIFKRLVIVGKALTDTEDSTESLSRRAGYDPMMEYEGKETVHITLPEDWKNEISMQIGSVYTVKSKNPGIYCKYNVYVDEVSYYISADVFIIHRDLSQSLNISEKSLESLAGDLADLYKVASGEGFKSWLNRQKSGGGPEDEEDDSSALEKYLTQIVKESTVTLPLLRDGLNIDLKLYPILKPGGDFSFTWTKSMQAVQRLGFTTKGLTALTAYSATIPGGGGLLPQVLLMDKRANFMKVGETTTRLDCKLNGSFTVGVGFGLSANLFHKNLAHASLGVEVGEKLSGEASINIFDSEDKDFLFYDKLKNTKLSFVGYLKAKTQIGVTPSDMLNFGLEWDILEFNKKECFLLPQFIAPHFLNSRYSPGFVFAGSGLAGGGGNGWSRMSTHRVGESGTSAPIYLYAKPNKEVLIPCHVGMVIRDMSGKELKRMVDDRKYGWKHLSEWEKEEMKIDVSELEPGETYRCYPLFSWTGLNYLEATPYFEFKLPAEMSLSVSELSLQEGKTAVFAISNGWKGKKIQYTKGVIEVSQGGFPHEVLVRALQPGTATIKVEDTISGKIIELPVTVIGDELQPIPENTYTMKYWFDDQKELAGELSSISAVMDLDVSGLSDGLHALHVTVCEDFEYLGHYETAPQTMYFIKEGPKTDIVYDYYVDGKKLMDSHTKTENLHTAFLPVQTIDEGLHRLTTVATLAGTAQTAVHNDFFVRTNNNNEESGMRLTVSIDDGAPTTLNRPLQNGSLSYDLDVKGLTPGLHRLNYQIASNGTRGVNTPPRTSFFLVDQKLDGYEYLLNGDETTAVKVGNLHADSPYELVTDLPVQPMPVRSSKFHFAVENEEPCVYGITDLNMRINDEFGAHADSTVEFIDVNVRQPLQNVIMLEKNIPAEVSAPGENVIRWFSLNAHRGDGIRLEASRPCTLQLFAPDGEELYNVSGDDATTIGEVNGLLTGTYYVALHDMGNEGDETVAVTWNTGNSILTQPVIASPGSNTVYKGTELNLSCATQNADIWYSTDGSRPTPECSRTHKYESPFVINDEMVLRAIATSKDMLVSDETAYRISIARLDRQQQLMKGWNWVSANSTSGDPMDVMTFLQPLEGSVQRMLSQTEDLFNDPQYGMIGNLSEVNTLEGYRLQLTEDRTYSWSGIASLPSLRPLQLYKGWNWIGFLPAAPMTPDMAFADFTPTEGDCVVGKTGFSTYTDGQWKGTLTSMIPGHAYHYHSAITTPMAYTNELPNDNSHPQQARAALHDRCPWQYDVYTYPDVTPVIAQLEPSGMLVSAADCLVGAFCGDECRGIGYLVDGLLFISIHASAAETSLINFRAFDSTTEQEIAINEHVVADGQLHGSVSQPLILHAISGTPTSMASQTAGVGRNTFDVYSLTGILVRRNATSLKGLKPGVYIINGQKVKL